MSYSHLVVTCHLDLITLYLFSVCATTVT